MSIFDFIFAPFSWVASQIKPSINIVKQNCWVTKRNIPEVALKNGKAVSVVCQFYNKKKCSHDSNKNKKCLLIRV